FFYLRLSGSIIDLRGGGRDEANRFSYSSSVTSKPALIGLRVVFPLESILPKTIISKLAQHQICSTW
ncbi:unnamed protein product, partial [marine sediment metagenome]